MDSATSLAATTLAMVPVWVALSFTNPIFVALSPSDG